MLEGIIKYLSVLTLSVFILSYCFLDGYYSKINIDILNYITGPEILNEMLPLTVWIVSYSLLFSISLSDIFGPTRKIDGAVNQTKKETLWTKKSLSATITYYVVIIGVGILLLNEYFENYYQLAPYFGLLLGFCVCVFMYKKYFRNTIKNTKVSIGFYFAMMTYFGYTSKEFGGDKLYSLLKTGNYYRVTFKVKDKLYKTDSSHIVVGLIQSSLFYYNKSDSTVTVFSRNGIDSISIGPRTKPKRHIFFNL